MRRPSVRFRQRIALTLLGTAVVFFASIPARAATNINSTTTEHWAWNDVLGWIDFYNTLTVNVTSPQLTGYASSSAGDISLDCATTSIGNICDTSDYKVLNDGVGNLSGWAWNDTYGWVSFCGGASSADCPGSVNYRTLVDPATGSFTQYAWNDVLGWISFNCADPGLCGTSNYQVKTSWTATSTSATLDSTTFDTGEINGAQFNYILWQGSYPSETQVQFQMAFSNASSGPWTYKGPDGTSNTFYTPTTAGRAITLEYQQSGNYRYFRYRARLVSNQAQTATPRVDAVIVGWTP